MKNSVVLALLLLVCAASSFAQSQVNAAGARLVAEHDVAYAKASGKCSDQVTHGESHTQAAQSPVCR